MTRLARLISSTAEPLIAGRRVQCHQLVLPEHSRSLGRMQFKREERSPVEIDAIGLILHVLGQATLHVITLPEVYVAARVVQCVDA